MWSWGRDRRTRRVWLPLNPPRAAWTNTIRHTSERSARRSKILGVVGAVERKKNWSSRDFTTGATHLSRRCSCLLNNKKHERSDYIPDNVVRYSAHCLAQQQKAWAIRLHSGQCCSIFSTLSGSNIELNFSHLSHGNILPIDELLISLLF